jgi:glutathione S-transferase
MVLEELQLPYKIQYKELAETKTEDYLQINPNGRLPAIKDPNSGLTLWEVKCCPGCNLFTRPALTNLQSGAIILYLVDRYDTEGKISYDNFPEKYLTQQWLAFQISGKVIWTTSQTYQLLKLPKVKAHTSVKRHGSLAFTQRKSPLRSIATRMRSSESLAFSTKPSKSMAPDGLLETRSLMQTSRS